MFNIIEKFLSIDGEGPSAGELATFIRFQGCNLRCSWCDTKYSYDEKEISEVLSAQQIYEYIKQNEVSNVTLTGGEPLMQSDIVELLKILAKDKSLNISIETNGSYNIGRFKKEVDSSNIKYILDFKLPLSKMTKYMDMENFNHLSKNDVYKFVIGSEEDLEYADKIIRKFNLTDKCKVFFSPVLGKIKLEVIVEFMKKNKLNGVKLQVQLHKIIWGSEERGV